MTEEQRQAWNAAVMSGDQVTIEQLKSELLDGINRKVMNEDANYARAGYTPEHGVPSDIFDALVTAAVRIVEADEAIALPEAS
jgi:hypothetical protein